MRALYQRAKTGKIKFIEFWTDGDFFHSKWGTLDSDKHQNTKKECEPKNTGIANATTAAQQAILEMEAKIKKKMENGYVEDLESIDDTTIKDVTLDNLPKSFTPCKPAPEKNMSKKFRDHPDTYGQRKRDGHCIILVKTETGIDRVYSRGMEDITSSMSVIPEVISQLNQLANGSMVLHEFCCVIDGKDNTRAISRIVRQKDATKVLERYNEYAAKGSFKMIPFDAMYLNGEFKGDLNYKDRYSLLSKLLPNVPVLYDDWQGEVLNAKTLGWEGFVLRNDTLGSKIHYTVNGKADKAGSFKLVFTEEDDFIVTGAVKGKAGKQTGLYAQFNLAQILNDGTQLDCGNCGPGKLKHTRLKELTEEIDAGTLRFPFTVQVEFRSQQPDSGKLYLPQLCEVRYDKKPEECITDFELE